MTVREQYELLQLMERIENHGMTKRQKKAVVRICGAVVIAAVQIAFLLIFGA